MVAPLILVLGLVLMIPLVRLIVVSLQDYGLDQILGGAPTSGSASPTTPTCSPPPSSGRRCGSRVQFVVAAVGITIGLGLLLAHLLAKVSGWVRVTMLIAHGHGVGDAADHRHADLALADRPAFRRAQLRAEQDRRAADPHASTGSPNR